MLRFTLPRLIRQHWAALGSLASLACAACAPPSAEPGTGAGGLRSSALAADGMQEVAQAIQGGTSDSETKAVVGIVFQTPEGYALCSGTLIAPNVVLSARHCVAPVNTEINGGIACSRSTFGDAYPAENFMVTTDASVFRSSAVFQGVREVLVPESGDKICGFDVSLLVLDAPISAEITAPRMPRVDGPAQKGEPYYAVGYGATNDAGSGSGRRRRRDNLTVDISAGKVPSYRAKVTEWQGETGICEGDSGGPAFDLQGRVIGVTSRGTTGCDEPIYGDVGSWGEWIRTETLRASEEEGLEAPPWARGYPTSREFYATVGGECMTDSDCGFGSCRTEEDRSYCTRPCEAQAPCPDDYTCEQPLENTASASVSGSGGQGTEGSGGSASAATGTAGGGGGGGGGGKTEPIDIRAVCVAPPLPPVPGMKIRSRSDGCSVGPKADSGGSLWFPAMAAVALACARHGRRRKPW